MRFLRLTVSRIEEMILVRRSRETLRCLFPSIHLARGAGASSLLLPASSHPLPLSSSLLLQRQKKQKKRSNEREEVVVGGGVESEDMIRLSKNLASREVRQNSSFLGTRNEPIWMKKKVERERRRKEGEKEVRRALDCPREIESAVSHARGREAQAAGRRECSSLLSNEVSIHSNWNRMKERVSSLQETIQLFSRTSSHRFLHTSSSSSSWTSSSFYQREKEGCSRDVKKYLSEIEKYDKGDKTPKSEKRIALDLVANSSSYDTILHLPFFLHPPLVSSSPLSSSISSSLSLSSSSLIEQSSFSPPYSLTGSPSLSSSSFFCFSPPSSHGVILLRSIHPRQEEEEKRKLGEIGGAPNQVVSGKGEPREDSSFCKATPPPPPDVDEGYQHNNASGTPIVFECMNKKNRLALRKRRRRQGERVSLRYR
ncbi:hypothetical protein CSUI_003687 [Cystoisospora suis]|uniref:Uncharacterized protein n=1 Tax=Cystoisospora suis TaxID=483139 RepID=A0A2C6L4L8_9APIC|nr:hypothetical protein CSUI_003687 [Cystoisospora suis]